MPVVPFGAGGVSREPLRGAVEPRPAPALGQLRLVDSKDLRRVLRMDGERVALVLHDGFSLVLSRSVACLAADIVGRPSPSDPIDAAVVDGARVGRL